jgi:hypothetical protein
MAGKNSDAPMRGRSIARLCLPAAGGARADWHFIQFVWPRSPGQKRERKSWQNLAHPIEIVVNIGRDILQSSVP